MAIAVRFQLVVDSREPEPLARFWAAVLGYVLEPPPAGFASWDVWRRHLGRTGDELVSGYDSIIDARGEGPYCSCSVGRTSTSLMATCRGRVTT